MTLSQMMIEAHRRARADFASDRADTSAFVHHSYAYYFRLQLRTEHAKAREARTGECRAFQVIEPWYKRQQFKNAQSINWVRA